MSRNDRRIAPRAAAAVLVATIGLTGSAFAQTPAVPAPTTPTLAPPAEIATTGAPIAANGTDGIPTPATNSCFARLFKPKDVPPQFVSEGSLVAQYRLRCSTDVTGYSFGFNRTVTSAETEVFPTYPLGAITPDQSFSCNGDFPGIGLSCVGTYKGGFNIIRGLVTFELTDEEIENKTPFCKLGLAGNATVFTSTVARDPYTSKALVNKDGTSQLRNLAAGPFRVTTPACHRGAKSDATEPAAARATRK